MSDDPVFVTKLNRNYLDDSAEVFEAFLESCLLKPFTLIVFDFSETMQFEKKARQAFLKFSQVLKQNDKHLASLNIKDSLVKTLKNEGTLDSFNLCPSLTAAKIKARCEPTETVFLRHFLHSCIKAFKVQSQINLKILKIHQEQKLETSENIDTQIEVNSSEYVGTLVLSMEPSVFKKMYFNMIGEDLQTIEDDDKDAACEMLNILFGLAKTTLVNEYDFSLQPAIPKLINSTLSNTFDYTTEIQSQYGAIYIGLTQKNQQNHSKVA